jgi:hypothetical protein
MLLEHVLSSGTKIQWMYLEVHWCTHPKASKNRQLLLCSQEPELFCIYIHGYISCLVLPIYIQHRIYMCFASQDSGALLNDDTDSMAVFFGGESRTDTTMLGRPSPRGWVRGNCWMEATVASSQVVGGVAVGGATICHCWAIVIFKGKLQYHVFFCQFTM